MRKKLNIQKDIESRRRIENAVSAEFSEPVIEVKVEQKSITDHEIKLTEEKASDAQGADSPAAEKKKKTGREAAGDK